MFLLRNKKQENYLYIILNTSSYLELWLYIQKMHMEG